MSDRGTDGPSIAWREILEDARGYLFLEPGEPVPVDELLEQAKANGWNERESRRALRETDVVVSAGDGPEAGVILADEREDTGPKDENPTLETEEQDSPTSSGAGGDDTRENALEAFADAVEFFHRKLDVPIADHTEDGEHPDRPTTAREYFEDVRGWDPETIDEKRLGWAPASDHALLDYLMRQGYDRDAILGTGLFYEDLTPHFQGRYVFPYFDTDGRPVYAISRSVDAATGGHPADPKGEQKYTKAVKTKDYSAVDEPTYGLETLEDGHPVLITEGMPDAITAHEAGYPCISPVTTQFKHTDRDRVRDVLEDRDVSRVYIVNDAEPATSDIDDEGRLTVEQFGTGEKGAVATAGYLTEHGLDALVAELPRPGLEKVDLDDYLIRWGGDLSPVLAGAKPADHHPAYDPQETAIDAALESRSPDAPTSSSNGTRSALFDLDIRDVTGWKWGERGNNPLGHHGDSEGYFKLLERYGVGFDHKHKVAYNALTYLLCDANERRPSSPNGSLEDREVLAAWRHAKQEGVIPDDDPIPHRALQHVALENGFCDADDVTDGWKLPTDAYNAALEHVDDVLGVNPGRGRVGEHAGEDAERVALLSSTPRQQAIANGWDWTTDGAERTDGLTIDDARDRCLDVLEKAMKYGNRVLVDALPSLGKSYGSIAAAATTDTPLTFLTRRGHKEQYEQIREWCDEHGLTHYTLPSFTHDCPTANGEHGEDWKRTVRDWYHRGATPKDIHKHAENELGRPLPCQANGGCHYAALWNFDPSEYDVLIGHYVHGYKKKVTAGRVVAIDEFVEGSYETDLSDATVGPVTLASAVSTYLEGTPALPFDDYTDLLEHRDDAGKRADALNWLLENDVATDGLQAFDADAGHAAAPLAVFTILAGDDLGNGWERAEFPDDDSRIGLFNRRENRVVVLSPPDLGAARGVLALDGTPTREMWELALGERLNHRQVLTEDERREYIRDALGLEVIQTTDAVKPYNSPDHVNVEQDAALLEGIADEHGRPASVITTSTGEQAYEDAELLERDENGDLTGDGERVADTKHYGNVLGSNEFKETRLGAVIGSNHYGDTYIKKWGAYAGLVVTDNRDHETGDGKGADLSYGTFGDKVLEHMRESETVQATMRFGRDGNGAVTYVHTNTLPEWFPIAGEGRVVNVWSDGMKQVLEATRDLGTWRTRDVVEHPAVDVGERQVFNHLERLRERGYLTREQNPDDGRGYVWRDDGLRRVNDHGDVDLEPVDLEDVDDEAVAELSRTTTYTWDFRNPALEDGDEGATSPDVPSSTPARGAAGADRDGPPPG
ncbi:hypothetical protein ACLI4Z_19255 (plasmid) [Natrialbaceae archaeon A-arb3/5]